MGTKTKTKSDPWAPAQPYILQNLADTKATYDANQPQLQKYANMEQDTYGRLAPGAEQGIQASQGLVNDTIGGKYLQGNPYLDGIINQTNRGITDDVNGQFGLGGRYGSGMHAGVLADKLATADNNLRYQNYATERQNQIGAIGQSQDLMSGAQGLLNNSAQLPWIGTQAQNGGTTQLSSPYGTRTQTTSGLGTVIQGIGAVGSAIGSVANGIGSAAGTIGTLSDARMKNIGPQVGSSPDGIPLYQFAYKGDPNQTPQVGPMAQEVAQVRPDAAGTGPDGLMRVDYNKLGLDHPTVAATGLAATFNPEAPQQMQLPQAQPRKLGLIGTLKDDPTLSKPENAARLFWARLAAASGNPLGQAIVGGRDDDLSRKDKEAQNAGTQLQRQIELRKALQPEHATVGGTYGTIDPTTGAFNPSYTAPDKPGEQERLIAAWGALPPNDPRRPLYERAIRGYAQTAPVLQMQGDIRAQTAERSAAAHAKYRAPAAASKAPPKYAAGPGGAVMKWVP